MSVSRASNIRIPVSTVYSISFIVTVMQWFLTSHKDAGDFSRFNPPPKKKRKKAVEFDLCIPRYVRTFKTFRANRLHVKPPRWYSVITYRAMENFYKQQSVSSLIVLPVVALKFSFNELYQSRNFFSVSYSGVFFFF